MVMKKLDFAEPFFPVRYVEDETEFAVGEKCILLNLSETPLRVQRQKLGQFQSVIVTNTVVGNARKCLLVERFAAYPNELDLLAQVKQTWPLAYDVRKEDRLKDVAHYLSPKVSIGGFRFSMYHSASVPLNVGLHKDHPHGGGAGFKEVHTQIVGYGVMQQCREKDVATLYLEEPMSPGTTHRPMYDERGNFPWHQYETVTPAIFMATEMLAPGVT